MIRELVSERPSAPTSDPTPVTGLVVAAAAVRGAAVALSGAVLTAGLALMLWAITPASGPDAAVAMRAGIGAFGAANLMPIVIDDVKLTVPPLMMTVMIVALLASTARRGRFLPVGRYQESLTILVTAGVYGLVVAATTRGFGPVDAVPASWVWVPPALAFVATAPAVCRRGSAWAEWWSSVLPDWARLGVKGGLIGVAVMVGGGAVALTIGLVAHFGVAVGVAAVAAPSWLDGLGLTVLGLAYLPNAVIAGVGYVSGAGFEIGPGTYSPFGTSTADLPAIPLLAAAPDSPGRSLIGLGLMLVTAVAGYLLARPAVRGLGVRSERVAATALGAGLTGLLLAGMALIARGGVGDGRWATIGVPPAIFGAVVIAEVGVVAATCAFLTDSGSVPWRRTIPRPAVGDRPADNSDRRAAGDQLSSEPGVVDSPADHVDGADAGAAETDDRASHDGGPQGPEDTPSGDGGAGRNVTGAGRHGEAAAGEAGDPAEDDATAALAATAEDGKNAG